MSVHEPAVEPERALLVTAMPFKAADVVAFSAKSAAFIRRDRPCPIESPGGLAYARND
jgi:hypothetical protein